MNEKALDNRAKINHLKNALDLGWITYDEAKELAKPVLEDINKKERQIAKKHGVRPRHITFTMVMR